MRVRLLRWRRAAIREAKACLEESKRDRTAVAEIVADLTRQRRENHLARTASGGVRCR